MTMPPDITANLPPIMTLQEAADACRLHHTTLRRAILTGRLRASKPTGRDIRITSAAIAEWLELTATTPKRSESLKAPPKKKSSKPLPDPSAAPATAPPPAPALTLPFNFGVD